MKPSRLVFDDHFSTPQRKELKVTPTHKPLFDTDKLTLCYGNQVAFRDISMTIATGKITALIGPSGCGKTSFINCLAHLIDQSNSTTITGRVLFEGENIYSRNIDLIALRQRIGVVFQKPNPFPFSIHKNIALPLREHGVKNKHDIATIIEDTLTAVGLWSEVKDRLHHSAATLSGGQQQRLCIARALALNPDVLLMDEPCSALDPISSSIVEDLICDLSHRYSVIMATHNLAQAKRIADSVAFFWCKNGIGHLVEHGSANTIFQHPQEPLTAAYISGAKG